MAEKAGIQTRSSFTLLKNSKIIKGKIKPNFKMKKSLILLVVLALAALLVLGCTQSNQYPSGYATSQQGRQQPMVGGGCGVAPVSDAGEPLQVSEPSLAA